MDILSKLFGSESKVRIMRLFLFNPETPFDLESIAERAKTTLSVARHEISALRKGRFIKGRAFVKRLSQKNDAKGNGMKNVYLEKRGKFYGIKFLNADGKWTHNSLGTKKAAVAKIRPSAIDAKIVGHSQKVLTIFSGYARPTFSKSNFGIPK